MRPHLEYPSRICPHRPAGGEVHVGAEGIRGVRVAVGSRRKLIAHAPNGDGAFSPKRCTRQSRIPDIRGSYQLFGFLTAAQVLFRCNVPFVMKVF